jgi:outer membrane protein
MKNALLVMNVVLLLAVGFLFYKVFNDQPRKTASFTKGPKNDSATNAANACRIAYFEMDSIDNNCEMVKDVRTELNRKEDASMSELSQLEQAIMSRRAEYQNQAATMTQAQGEAAQQDLFQRGQKLQTRKQELDQEYQNLYMRLNTDMKKKIETFLNEYNNANTYSYIFAYENGLFFYKDSAYNITRDVVSGLNLMYRDQKPKKK